MAPKARRTFKQHGPSDNFPSGHQRFLSPATRPNLSAIESSLLARAAVSCRFDNPPFFFSIGAFRRPMQPHDAPR
jgi:hypothetical protein